MKISVFRKKKYQALFSRLAIALVAVSMGAVLILWDTGIIDLPFLSRKEKDPTSPEKETQGTEEKEIMDWAAFAHDAMDSLAAYSSLENPESLITTELFNSETMSLVKVKLNKGTFNTQTGVLSKEDGKDSVLFSLPDLTEIPGSGDYKFTNLRDGAGRGVYQHKKENTYFYLDRQTLTFVPTEVSPTKEEEKTDFMLPIWYGNSDSNITLFRENDLYGYSGSFMDGKKEVPFTVSATYPTAFPYREGFAVMADENRKVTIRNERGEAVFTDLSLILPDKSGEDALGFHYFDGGVLRVVIAGYDEEGNITSKRESVINKKGQEIPLPEGFTVRSLLNGVLTVSDGEHYGYLSSLGTWIASPVYQSAEPFFEGLAVVTNEEGKMGLIDTRGKEVLPCAFDQVTSVSDGFALCYSHGTGYYLLAKVQGRFGKGNLPQASTYYTKITITRGPQNTFDYEPDEIIELPPVLTTISRTTHPENTVAPKDPPGENP